MYENIKDLYRMCSEAGFDDPLQETISILDFIAKGAIRDISLSYSDDNLNEIIRKRKSGIPIDYVFKRTYFMGYEFICTPDTLIPTPETSELVRIIAEEVNGCDDPDRIYRIIDMGTGCGNIAISIGNEVERAMIFATDLSEEAIAVAGQNIADHDLSDRITALAGDLFEPLREAGNNPGSFDIIVCNPPYLPTESIKKLPSEIRDHEPHLALDAGPFGIDFFVRLLEGSLEFLKTGGSLVFEIGEGQGKLVRRLLRRSGGYSEPIVRSYNDSERFFKLTKL